jgi:L-malate glycosyltransferase
MKISSPIAYGSGAYIAHKSIESSVNNYKVVPYNPYWTLFPPAIQYFGDKSADIIHAPIDYSIFSRLPDKPMVSTFHNFVLDPYMQQYASYVQQIHYRTDLRWFILQALKQSNVVTCVSNFLAELIKENLSYKGEIRVIYNGIDTNKFYPYKREINSNKKIKVLFCGNLIKRKGVELIPDILNRVGSNVELVYTSGLRSNKTSINHPKASCIGSVEYNAMTSLYNEVDILLFPTVREGFGLAVAEAMSCGLPVVATDCSSLPELVDDKKGGYLCPIDNIDLFAEKIDTLAQSVQLRKDMGDYNREKIEKCFTLSRMAKEYKNLFEETIP